MSTSQLLQQEIEQTPEPLLIEVYHFLKFLKQQAGEDRFEGLLLSESALAKDWNTPEEDAAWASL